MIIFSGPSGVGKGTLLRAALQELPQWRLSVSATTRAPREGEVDGEHYHFMDEATFDRLVNDGAFVEAIEFAGARYGTLRLELSKPNTILEIDVRGAQALSELAQATVFVAPPSMEELERRLFSRGTESPERARDRLRQAEQECAVAALGGFSHTVVNGGLEIATSTVVALCRNYQQD
jgi:guanylate kinase